MGFHVMNRMGEMFSDPEPSVVANVLDELAGPWDPEHPGVGLIHDSEWCLSVFVGGLVIWENLDEGDPRHLRGVERERVARLWRLLSTGDILAVEDEDWLPGHG